MGVRSFPVPEAAQTHGLTASADYTALDHAARRGNEWAEKVLAKEQGRILGSLLGEDRRLPVGVLADGSDDTVVALYRHGKAWRGAETGWQPVTDNIRSIQLDAGEVAFVARAFVEDAQAVILRPTFPAATITAAAAGGAVETPDGAKMVAVVDDVDRSAVMDLVAILPGPKVLRRHDGDWHEDKNWLSILRSVKPPPIVVLDDSQVGEVAAQIDAITAGVEWEDTDLDDYLNASAWRRAEEIALRVILAAPNPARAVASKVTPGGTMPLQLRRYWTYGGGAAKIRWGTPGAMTRCARYLRKYVGPQRAHAVCNNISKPLGGKGVAWDVG